MGRIWGGVHFRTSNEVGEALGPKVGIYVLQTMLAPPSSQARPVGGQGIR
jgi:hypothetical protein